MSLVGYSSEVVGTSDTVAISPNDGFELEQDCTMTFALRGDTSDTVWAYFLKGVFYPWDIEFARTTGTTASTTLLIIRGRKG